MFINFFLKVKLKRFVTTFVAGASLLAGSYTQPILAGGTCDDPDVQNPGTVFKWTGPDSWKIWTTVRQSITSNNERKVAFALKKLDLKAETELAKFVNTNVKSGSKLTEKEKANFVVGTDDETSEDAIEGFDEIVSEFSSSTEALLVGAQFISSCHTPGKEVRLTRGINSESAIGAQRIKNQDFGGNSNSTNLGSPTKTYRRDVNEGFSSYGNFENF